MQTSDCLISSLQLKNYLAIAADEQHWLIFARLAEDTYIGLALDATQSGFSLSARNRLKVSD